MSVTTWADVAKAVDGAPAVPDSRSGFLGPLVGGMEDLLRIFEGTFERAGVPYAYGFAIIGLTILIKALTFPLTKKQVCLLLLALLPAAPLRLGRIPYLVWSGGFRFQVESSLAIQRLQPQVKALQERHKGDQQTLQMETARLYKDAQVNPLAGKKGGKGGGKELCCLSVYRVVPSEMTGIIHTHTYIYIYIDHNRRLSPDLGNDSRFHCALPLSHGGCI